jgi:cation:H+ antiporter
MWLAIVIPILTLIIGIIIITYSSKIAVVNSARLASALGISSLVIGITLVSIGTDISEIFNSIISCAMGHGDIDVGDSIGSVLTQLTFVFGLLPFICGVIHINRKEFLIIGACEVLSLILVFTVVEKGYFTRLDAIFMIGSFFFYTLITYNVTKSDMLEKVDLMKLDGDYKNKSILLIFAVAGFLGVAFSSYIIVQSIISLAALINIDEYLISFFILSIGTSLPELTVELNALKSKEYNIAIGDVLGSCIVDSSISIAIGQLLFPQEVTASLAIPTILYTLFASIGVVALVSIRRKMDKKAGAVLIALYGGSFLMLFFLL